MFYALAKRTISDVGVRDDDPAPRHLECEHPLKQIDDTTWACTGCHKRGRAVLAEPPSLSPTPTAAERMQKRWDQCWPGAYDVPDLSSPMVWGLFLRDYFRRGVWVMRAHDDATHTVPEDSYLHLGYDIAVAVAADGLLEVVVREVSNGHPLYFKNVVELRELDFGIILATSARGEHVRLDAHLLDQDVRVVSDARR